MSRLSKFQPQTGFITAVSFLTSVSAVFMLGFCSCQAPHRIVTCGSYAPPCTVAAPCACASISARCTPTCAQSIRMSPCAPKTEREVASIPAPAPVHNPITNNDSLLQDPQVPANAIPQKVAQPEISVQAETPKSAKLEIFPKVSSADAEAPDSLKAAIEANIPDALPGVSPEKSSEALELPTELQEVPSDSLVEPMLAEFLPLEEATLLDTDAMAKPQIPQKKNDSGIKSPRLNSDNANLDLEIKDASAFSKNLQLNAKKISKPKGEKTVLSPLLKVSMNKESAMKNVKNVRFNISAETLRKAVHTVNNTPKMDYGIRLTAAEMPISAGKDTTPREIAMPTEAAIATRLKERPTYAEPADEYIIDTARSASQRDLGKAKKMKIGAVEVEDNWQADAQEQSGTFIYYSNAQGRSTVQSPDPVYIYAPRFRSVRQIVDLNVDSQVMSTGDISKQEEIFIQGRNAGADTAKQNAQTHTESGRTVMIQAQGATGSNQVDGAISLQTQNQEAVIAQENRTFIGPQATAGKNRANTASGLVEISAWTKTDSLQVFIEKESASVAVRLESAPSINTVTEGENKQDVRIYKVSSKTNAKPGETVDFIIYFENTGVAPVGNITLVDNLPARLEIVKDSAESSVDSSFTYEINGTGSQTLRWEITQPLYAGEKGAVKFRALVR